MRQYKFALTLIAAAVLFGCGGGSGGGSTATKIKFSSQVSFGDSLSDVGSYAVGPIAALKGGKFNINGNISADLTGKNWTELMAAQLGLPAPCPALLGGFGVPPVSTSTCTAYGQGGARVAEALGIGNTGVTAPNGAPTGAMTVPVATQIQNHLNANGGAFKGDSVVFVLAGANDVFTQLNILAAGATAAGQAAGAAEGAKVGAQTFATTLIGSLAAGATNPATAAQAIGLALATENARPGHTDQTVVGAAVQAAATQPGNAAVGNPAVFGPMVVAAQTAATTAGQAAGATAGAKAGADYVTANAPLAVVEMGRVAGQLAALIKTQIVAKGANYVIVSNLPDISLTPDSLSQSAATQGLVKLMTTTFNDQLRSAVAGDPKILYSEVFNAFTDEVNNPAIHGLTNVKDRACDLTPAKNPLHSSLVCNASNLIAGDVSHYLFSDGSHPTPYGYLLLARFISKDMEIKGWL